PEMKSYIRGSRFNALGATRGGDQRSDESKMRRASLKGPVQGLAQRYGVDRGTLRRDGRFAAALDRVTKVCGAEVRRLLLTRGLKATPLQVVRLAQLEPEAIKEAVGKARATGKRLELPRPKGRRKSVTLHLAAGKPRARAQAVLDRL